MARPTDRELLVRLLPDDGHGKGNATLIQELKWSKEKYLQVRDLLLDEGVIVLGPGRGGSVRLVRQLASTPSTSTEAKQKPTPTPPEPEADEAALYEPLCRVLRADWKADRRLDELHAEVTARQGRRQTGGTWTRPDLTAVSTQTFAHWRGRLDDVWTFEVKPKGELNVTGVFEAAAHSRFATRSYAMFHVDPGEIGSADAERCVAEAGRFGLGIVFFEDPANFDTWDIRVHAVRREPDPALIEEFIVVQLSAEAKQRLLKWWR